MAIPVTCACSKQIRLKDVFAGKRVKCPACGKGITVPAPTNGTTSAAPAEAGSSPFAFDSPAMEALPEMAGSSRPAVPVAAPWLPAANPDSSEPTKKGRRALIAILASFLLLLAGLVVVVVLLLNGSDADDPERRGGFAGNGNKGDKLRLEEEEAANPKRLRDAAAARARVSAVQKQQEQDEQRARDEAARQKAVEDAEKRLALKQAEDAKLKQTRVEAEKRRVLEAQNREEARKLVGDGQIALNSGQLDKAKLAFEQANKLDPANKDAQAGLAKAAQELTKTQNKVKHDQLVAAGKKSLNEKKYDLAVSSLKLAIELDPNDTAAADALKKAEAEKRKLDAELDKHLGRGYRALKRHDFSVAEKAFDDADKFAPGHPKVAQARQALVNERGRLQAEAAARKKLEEEQRLQLKKDREDFDKYIKQGRDALKAKRYGDAERDFTLASKLVPDDKVARSLLRQAREGIAQTAEAEKRARLAEEMRKRREAREKATALVKNGKKALEDKLFQEAVTSLTEADRLVPGDKVTTALLKKAQTGLQEQLLASAKERKKQEEARKSEQTRKLFAEARQALNDKKYDLMDKLLTELVKLVPNDPDVIGLRKDLEGARKAIADENAKKARAEAELKARLKAEADRKKLLEEFDERMKVGKTALTGKKFDEAVKAYSAALKMVQKQAAFTEQEKQAAAALEGAKKAKDRDDKLKLKLEQ
jgi:tetratricopeptide (TPR) repeat protein